MGPAARDGPWGERERERERARESKRERETARESERERERARERERGGFRTEMMSQMGGPLGLGPLCYAVLRGLRVLREMLSLAG